MATNSKSSIKIIVIAVAACVILIIGFVALAGIYVYNSLTATQPTVTLPFSDYGKKLVITNNLSAKDASYDQVLQFMEEDDTENKTLSTGDSIVRLHDNAEKQGIKAGVAVIKPIGHKENGVQVVYACNVFKTTDQSTIYVKSPGRYDGEGGDSVLLFTHNERSNNDNIYFIPLENATGRTYKQLDKNMGWLAIDYSAVIVTEYW